MFEERTSVKSAFVHSASNCFDGAMISCPASPSRIGLVMCLFLLDTVPKLHLLLAKLNGGGWHGEQLI